METTAVQKSHKLVLNNRKTGLVTGVLDVLSFNLNEILLETEQGMLMVKGTDLHVNRVNLERERLICPAILKVSLIRIYSLPENRRKVCLENCFAEKAERNPVKFMKRDGNMRWE